MVAPDPIDDVSTHPMVSAARTTPSALSSYLRRVRRTCGLAPPVQSDVWLRLLFNMLPVNSRFAYLQRQRPDAICCAYGCGAAESQQHAFYDCEVVHQVWALHAGAWRRFGVTFSWNTISDIDAFSVNGRGEPHKAALRVLWSLLTASLLHLIWKQHNGVQYEHKRAIPAAAWHDLSFVGWMASVRHWLRLQDADCPARAAVLDVVRMLHGQPAYQPLVAKYPLLLRLGPSLRPA
ncbi:hypothetical protein SPRG_09183 [Saprolegnia parasitica CBS 223.65]|uniref:Reverse transcriptase zinc-binding domain-containing protein n=1 Tax=Saprolegnia parasitica (strain CBS 223.65) TaxID=695850 RepID=A0A067C4B6_SAPPC|nr:hypothetical protein SPRG_09183 [Saprolegnia parasitica CBS 223.65]KDO25358.1 hypothetical protein SPRG_09183 [Saprolegnia parasitica CBS 223.65]|eukprot:XP_012204007.1 hypothetical protein SPRG_09183 [Saprolegnia parasitica CBS 223.65]